MRSPAAPSETRRERGDATRGALMRAAEALIAERGIENVSIRAIVRTAGQKNESALQYHFGSLRGLLESLHDARRAEIGARRTALLRATLARSPPPTLRETCRLMVQPAFELAGEDGAFRNYVKAFGHRIALTHAPAVDVVDRSNASSIPETVALLRASLPHLDESALQRRLDGAVRFTATSMLHHARQQDAFRGPHAELFFSALIDALVGMLSAPESDETRALARTLPD